MKHLSRACRSKPAVWCAVCFGSAQAFPIIVEDSFAILIQGFWWFKYVALSAFKSQPTYTETTCWSGSHWDYRDQTAGTLWASMPLRSPPQDVLRRTRTVQTLELETCFELYFCKQSWQSGWILCSKSSTVLCLLVAGRSWGTKSEQTLLPEVVPPPQKKNPSKGDLFQLDGEHFNIHVYPSNPVTLVNFWSLYTFCTLLIFNFRRQS